MSRSLSVFFAIAAIAVMFQSPASAGPRAMALEDMIFDFSNWNLFQSSKDNDTAILNLSSSDSNLTVYSKPAASFNMRDVFANDSTVIKEEMKSNKGVQWSMMHTRREMPMPSGKETSFVSAFSTVSGGRAYYGYVRATSASVAEQKAKGLLDRATLMHITPGRSLTGADYRGAKYYFGWGAAMNGDPNMMHNEVKYDVQHTHDIFTKDVGGNYASHKLIGPSTNKKMITDQWTALTSKMTSDDMYVQYSSGHGSNSGLAVGVSYNEMRDAALAMPAKEIIIFTMACYSGNLVNSFNNKKSVWQDWANQGRTLLVMSSSKGSETSSTGPGTDKDEAGGPSGSAGSAFGHALWKSLIGYADGYVDGVKDGFISLEEITKYATARTVAIGDHTPMITGTYKGALVMNRVPPKSVIEQFENGTEGLTDEEIMERVQELNAQMAIR